MIALILEAAGPVIMLAILLAIVLVWERFEDEGASEPGLYDQERDGFADPKDCQHCGAPGPYSEHPGVCWGCIQRELVRLRACDCFDDLPYRKGHDAER